MTIQNSTILEVINDHVEQVDLASFDPSTLEPIQKGDEYIGKADESIMRLFIAFQNLGREANEAWEKALGVDDSKNIKDPRFIQEVIHNHKSILEEHPELGILSMAATALQSMAALQISATFRVAPSDSITIREGQMIVFPLRSGDRMTIADLMGHA